MFVVIVGDFRVLKCLVRFSHLVISLGLFVNNFLRVKILIEEYLQVRE